MDCQWEPYPVPRSVSAQFQTRKKQQFSTEIHTVSYCSLLLYLFTCPFVCLLCDLQTCFLPQGCCKVPCSNITPIVLLIRTPLSVIWKKDSMLLVSDI